MQTARKYLTALLLSVLPLAAEAAHQPLPVHGHEEELVEHHHGGTAPAAPGAP